MSRLVIVLACACALLSVWTQSVRSEENKTEGTGRPAPAQAVASPTAAAAEKPADTGTADNADTEETAEEAETYSDDADEMPEKPKAPADREQNPPAADVLRAMQPIVVASAEEVAAREIIERALDEETKFDFTDLPLTEAVAYWTDFHQIKIQLDYKALEEASIGIDTPVTRTLSGITLRSALRFVLTRMDLAFVVRDEMLVITTREKAAGTLVVKIYLVADLVIPRDDDRPSDALQKLVEVIRATVVPAASPARATVVVMPGRQSRSLIVLQTDEVHEKVTQLLAGMRRARDLQDEQRRAGTAKPQSGRAADRGLISRQKK